MSYCNVGQVGWDVVNLVTQGALCNGSRIVEGEIGQKRVDAGSWVMSKNGVRVLSMLSLYEVYVGTMYMLSNKRPKENTTRMLFLFWSIMRMYYSTYVETKEMKRGLEGPKAREGDMIIGFTFKMILNVFGSAELGYNNTCFMAAVLYLFRVMDWGLGSDVESKAS